MTDPTSEQFLNDVKDHKLSIIRDDGVYRHIRLAEPGTSCMHFDLITWPGYLCYTGDMGTYVFTRTQDMFCFFRGDGKLRINLGYWSEKLVAVDGRSKGGSAKEFSEEKFRAVINQYRVDWIRSHSEGRQSLQGDRRDLLTKDERRELWESVEDRVFGALDDYGEHGASMAAYEFSYIPRRPGQQVPRRSWQFTDLFEHDFTEYTFHFVWCCYALAWGIQQYDAMKEAASVPAAS